MMTNGSRNASRARVRTLDELHELDDPVVAHEAHFAVGMRGKMHSHARAQLICATTTPMEVVAGERQWTVQPGRAAWLPGGVGHSISGPGVPCVFRSLYIRPDVATRLGGQAGVLGLSPLLTELFLRMIEIYEGGDAGMYPHLTALVLDEISRAEPRTEVGAPPVPMPRDRRLKLICEALVNRPADRRTLEEWGKAAGASARTLERLFRAETEMSFNTWRQACRMAAAIPKLQQGQPVQRVAWEVGYDSSSSFSAIFRRVVGMNPAGMNARH
ncbi:MAG: helix-turn-helix transcriptional regulator [Rhizobium sp.]|nr:helix-turn-helix transcriptional regulator [Rhizobium sp.]